MVKLEIGKPQWSESKEDSEQWALLRQKQSRTQESDGLDLTIPMSMVTLKTILHHNLLPHPTLVGVRMRMFGESGQSLISQKNYPPGSLYPLLMATVI